MKAIRTLLSAAVLVVGLAAPAAAQTTSTTMPPVRSIPVTPAPTSTTARPATTPTTAAAAPAAAAPAPAAAAETAAPPMADTGLAADKLVPLGLLLIAVGALLHGGSRRVGRIRYDFL